MSHECEYDACDRTFDSKQGLGQHQSATHESSDEYKNRQTLEELYVERGLTSREIATKFDISKSTVLDWLNRHDIPTRPSTHDKPPNFRTNPLGYEEVRSGCDGQRDSVLIHRLVAVAEFGVDAVAGVDVHHVNDIQWDNRPDNLSLMSRSEHVSHHHEEGLYDEHLEEVHQHRHDDGRLAHVPVEEAWGGDSA